MRPLIGIPCHAAFREDSGRPIYCNNRAYSHAVESAGGVPVLIPMLNDLTAIKSLLVRLDGLLLSGGVDIQPDRYHEEELPCLGEIDMQLDQEELTLLHCALQEDMPVLGICRGMQMINVALGGTLYQDLGSLYSDKLDHCRRDLPRDTLTHAVYVDPGSRMEQLLGTREFPVNSLHHQSVKVLGEGVQITGRAEDGVPELLEVAGYRFVLAIQGHPEEIFTKVPACANLFKAFIEACSRTSAMAGVGIEQLKEVLPISA